MEEGVNVLLDSYMEPYVLLEKARQPDGEGGWIVTYTDGITFEAAVTLDTTIQARIGEQQGLSSVFTVTTSKACLLEYHDVIRRVSDGTVFRITSRGADKRTPPFAGLDIAQVSAERWDLA